MTGDSTAGDLQPSSKRWRPSHGVIAFGLIGLTLGVMFVLHSGVLHPKTQTQTSARVDNAQAVTVAIAQPTAFARTITIAGEVRPRDDVRVYAPTQGVRIVQLLVDEGDTVRAGQPLARLDTNLAAAQISAAQAQVAEARAAATRTRDAARRADSIRDTGALSLEAIEAREAEAVAAQARLRAAEAQLAEVNARLQGGFVRAPQAGIVLARTAQLGAPVDGQPLFRIAGGGALEVAVEVGEADMLALTQGQSGMFRLIDGVEVKAMMRRGAASIDSRTRTGTAVFDLPRDARLRPGMFLRGETTLPSQTLLAAPQNAIVFDQGDAHLFIVDDKSIARRVKVRLGPRNGDMIAVLEGLEPGSRIVAGGAAFLRDGDAVRPVDTPPAQSTGSQAQLGLRGR
jgi:HlyD family secretion protein